MFWNKLLSDNGEVSSKRVVGFLSFIFGTVLAFLKALVSVYNDMPMDLIYVFFGLTSACIAGTALEKIRK